MVVRKGRKGQIVKFQMILVSTPLPRSLLPTEAIETPYRTKDDKVRETYQDAQDDIRPTHPPAPSFPMRRTRRL